MEKIIYLAWRSAGTSAEDFAARLRGPVAEALHGAGVRHLRLNLPDAYVAPAAQLRQVVLDPQPDAVLQLWVDSAVRQFRAPFDEAIAAPTSRLAAYLVTESVPLRNTRHPPLPGGRTRGFAQIAILRRPPRLTYEQWLDHWQNVQTTIALETQSTFEYVQNAVVRSLLPHAPAIDAIVEECFPEAAMNDFKAFFDAPGDDARFQNNLKRMMDSVQCFIDGGTIDVVPTSQYDLF